MSIDFPLILVVLTTLTGLICLVDKLFFMPGRKARAIAAARAANSHVAHIVLPKLVEHARSFFPVLLIVLIIRSFIVQPYRVPSGSLEPTILPGDFIAVSQFSYGLRLPVIGTKILKIGEPHRGDIVVFPWPANHKFDLVKRTIGLPGDHIVYQNRVLFINGQEAKQTEASLSFDDEPFGDAPAMRYEEDLMGVKHQILIRNQGGETWDYDFVVPKGYYFMMGDNRDDSADSRFWGLVPESDLAGKAFMIWMSWDSEKHRIRWHRIGTLL